MGNRKSENGGSLVTSWRPVLSNRLKSVAAMVKGSGVLADVGTDHGYIPIVLVQDGQFERAVAMDIGKGPLERAEADIRQARLEEQIETRLSDGLKELKQGEAQSVVIAGMGGALTERILDKDPAVTSSVRELVLEPQSEIYKVRRWLWENGWYIADEDMVLEDGKFYPVLEARQNKKEAALQKSEETEDGMRSYYGPVLLLKKHPVLRLFLEKEQRTKEAILKNLDHADSQGAEARKNTILADLERNSRAMKICSG